MALESTFTPKRFEFEIQQGAHFHLEFPPFVSATTGLPFDFTTDPEGEWLARMDLKNRMSGTLVTFATSGEDGVIELGSDGVVRLDLADEFTDLLEPTTAYDWSAGKGAVFGDLVLVDPADDEPWVFLTGKGSIRKKVTD